MNAAFDYSGTELEIFAHATHWKRYWREQIQDYIGDQVLDVGAGIGATARNLNTKSYQRWLSLEPDASMCAHLQQQVADDAKLNSRSFPSVLQSHCGTLSDLPVAEEFDTVLYIDVLEHIENDRAELLRAMAQLKPGGKIVIVAPAHQFLYTPFDKKIGHYRRYNKAMLRAIVPAGLRIEKLRYLDSVGMLASSANRFLLQSDSPSMRQVQIWDRWMVRSSRWIDPILGYMLGKSIVCVLTKTATAP
jgi:2-polyprenyl-3-methyl-5-hydroxy-6-metoxy-1,4-benzoquinol methylase